MDWPKSVARRCQEEGRHTPLRHSRELTRGKRPMPRSHFEDVALGLGNAKDSWKCIDASSPRRKMEGSPPARITSRTAPFRKANFKISHESETSFPDLKEWSAFRIDSNHYINLPRWLVTRTFV